MNRKALFISVVFGYLISVLQATSLGDSCANAYNLGSLSATSFPVRENNLRTFSTSDARDATFVDPTTCSPSGEQNFQPEGFWITFTVQQELQLFLHMVSPNADSATNFSTSYLVLEASSSCASGAQCLARVHSDATCLEFAPRFTAKVGLTYYIWVYKRSNTGAGNHFEIILKQSTLKLEETFTSIPPVDWVTTGGSMGTRPWLFGTTTSLSTTQVTFPARTGNIAAVNSFTSCENGFPSCDQRQVDLTTSEVDLSGSNEPLFLNLVVFFNDATTTVQTEKRFGAEIYAGVDSGSGYVWTLLSPNLTSSTIWRQVSYSLDGFGSATKFQVRFRATNPLHPNAAEGGFALASVQISADSAPCDDGWDCTTDTCSVTTGCSNANSNSWCEAEYPASCFSRVCDPTDSLATGEGCVLTPNDGLCTGKPPCVVGTCDDPTDNSNNNGCSWDPDDSLCDDSSGCTDDKCDFFDGCQNEPKCDDEIICTIDDCDTIADQCTNIVNDTLCDDGIFCTLELPCDTRAEQKGTDEAGCVRIPLNTRCDDGNPCTIDICNPSSGCENIPKNCDDGIRCTVDSCNPTDGSCLNTANDTLCDDGIACTQDVCRSDIGICVNIPNDGLCSPTTMCQIASCNPGVSLLANGCIETAKSCDDGIPCTVDSCDPVGGSCQNVPDHSLCNDNLNCTVDTCDDSLGKCTNIPSNADCDDSNPCTIDICNCAGGCEHIEKDCSDAIACTVDTCDPTTGVCVNTPSNSLCEDDYNCTIDECNVDLGRCTNIPDDNACQESDLCFNYYCNPAVGGTPTGCTSSPIICDDDMQCTTDSCISATGTCVFTPVDSMCDDSINCTVDVCSQALGKCVNTPDNSLCDDGNPCTLNLCACESGCDFPLIDCTDAIPCTDDYCDTNTGLCVNDPNDVHCNDTIDCTIDTCNKDLGRCTNIPSDAACEDLFDCTEDICSLEFGCVHIAHDNLCDDKVECTIDSCDTATGCHNDAKDSLCDDGVICTVDVCDPVFGCYHNPDNNTCDDQIECTIDICDEVLGCLNIPIDSLCDDNVTCTVDTCDADNGCQYRAENSWCSDGIGCTEDICDVHAGQCVNTPIDARCDDGFSCTVFSCDAHNDCQIDHSGCPWFDLPKENSVCLNCMSTGSRLVQLSYKDGTGALQLQTRNLGLPNDLNDTLTTNLLMTPTGQVVLGASSQQDGPILHKDDGLVIDGNFRLVPSSDALPACNEYSRGLMIVREVESTCGSNTCYNDVLYICVLNQDYEWKAVSTIDP